MPLIPYGLTPIMNGTIPYGGITILDISVPGKGPGIKKVTLDKGTVTP